MPFFHLERTTDLNVIGKSIQVENCIFPVHMDLDPRSTKSFWFEKADLDKLLFPEPIVHPRAKLTDFIGCHIIGTRSMPLVSPKLKLIIESVRNNKPQFIPAKVHYKNEVIQDYCFLNCYNFAPEAIDFTKSIVKWSSYKKPPNGDALSITSINEYKEIEKKLKPPIGIRIEPVFLNALADSYDFFSLKWIYGSGLIVNEKFVSIIMEYNVTGIQFMGLNEKFL